MHTLPKFVAVGAVSTAVDFIVLNVAAQAGAAIGLAATVGFLAGFCTGYYLNSHWTFALPPNRRTLIRYFLMNLGSLVFTDLIVTGLANNGLNYNIAKVVSVIIVFVWNYTMSKRWVYVSTSDS